MTHRRVRPLIFSRGRPAESSENYCVIPMGSTCGAYRILGAILAALEAGGVSRFDGVVDLRAGGSLRSAFAASDLAQASVAAAGVALARFMAVRGGREEGAVVVDRDLASAWFQLSIRPLGWELPPPWDPVAGDYWGVDGWVRLHTNAAHHRRAALAVLGAPVDRSAVASAVSEWKVDALEDAVVKAGVRPLRCGRWRPGASILKVARWPPSRCWHSTRDHRRALPCFRDRSARRMLVRFPESACSISRASWPVPLRPARLRGGARMCCGSTRLGGTKRRLFPR